LPDVSILTLLASSTQQNHKPFAVSAEVDPISGAEIDAVLENPVPTLFTLEKLPLASRYNATATFSEAGLFNRSNQSPNELLPSLSRYSRKSITTSW
jgi:hypothetical protein